MKSISLLCLAGTFLLAGIQPVSAITITVFEQITDTNSGDGRNLRRTRWDGINSPVSETSDTPIERQNRVREAFGELDERSVTFTHRTAWLGISVFTGAVLTITAGGASNGLGVADDDRVSVDGMFLGALGNQTAGGATSFVFSGAAITALLADDAFDVLVNKSPGDSIEIRRSRLTLTYEIPDPVNVSDRGSTVVLLGFALTGIAGLRRLFSARASRNRVACGGKPM
jgi:hypothetical protein